ncbi:dTDP-4-dehydrorhamnose 3,5-epimerase [Bradyrhizobium genosp. L]|uniref:dTDP-4-dehydrorhamnose 3,5-epimerase n=1 Tax=Bradyrhizobium genosp. L TaxID=83637 RepID=UPI0018A26B13|nr:dTDP-4-dehydrorhamnose 3,5-epimerase [Bradyrhizobium genosp. L]QPF86533.1 dTDP-4-dehydrorhamnose 3,5-epimerase [Bradyrhizobium genosp. L]
MGIDVCSLALSSVKLINIPRFGDGRGYFSETFKRSEFAAMGIDCDFIQDNQSSSTSAGTVRGLHFQRPPYAQAKLVRVLRGSILDVAVDLRWSSPSFGRSVAVTLTADGGEQAFIPAGFAHGFCTLEPDTVVLYKVDQVYSPKHEGGIKWDDPSLRIEWPSVVDTPVLSEKDQRLPRLSEVGQIFE